MTTLDSIAVRLAALYGARSEYALSVWKAEQDIAARQAQLTPADGWTGSNDKAREAARVAAFAADSILTRATVDRNQAQAKLMELAGSIEAAEAERRAAEWTIRARLVEALDRKSVQANGRGDRAESAFDDAAQHSIDRKVIEALPF